MYFYVSVVITNREICSIIMYHLHGYYVFMFIFRSDNMVTVYVISQEYFCPLGIRVKTWKMPFKGVNMAKCAVLA